MTDHTHDAGRRSWVASANGHAAFPLQNLPLGVFSRQGDAPRGGVAIGDSILDLTAALVLGLLKGEAGRAAEAACGASLNALFALGDGPRAALRARLFELLEEGEARAAPPGPAAAARCGGLHAAPAGGDRRLHRLLRRHPSRDERRAAAAAG